MNKLVESHNCHHGSSRRDVPENIWSEESVTGVFLLIG